MWDVALPRRCREEWCAEDGPLFDGLLVVDPVDPSRREVSLGEVLILVEDPLLELDDEEAPPLLVGPRLLACRPVPLAVPNAPERLEERECSNEVMCGTALHAR